MTGRITGCGAGLAGLVAFVLVGTGAGPTVLGGLGVLALGGGVLRGRLGAVSVGCASLFGALLWAGVRSGGAATGASPGAGGWAIVAAGGAIVLAWTLGRSSVELRRDLPDADTRRLESTQVAGTTVLVGGAVAIVSLPGLLTVGSSPLGLVLVVFGAVTLTTAVWLE